MLGKNERYRSIKDAVQSFANAVLQDANPRSATFSFDKFARPGCRPFVLIHIDQGEDLGYTTLSVSPRDHHLRRLKPVKRTAALVLTEMGLEEKITS